MKGNGINDPRKIRIEDYTYDLPDDRIARFPLDERDASKLLVYKNRVISDDVFKSIDKYIPDNSIIIFNDTKVIQARIQFERKEGKSIEILCLEPHSQPIEAALQSRERSTWECMIGNLKKWKSGKLDKKFNGGFLSAELNGKYDDNFLVEFSWEPAEFSFAEILDHIGEMPIPPYLKRQSDESDKSRYQTVYADHEGSVAAPTAGLHFTNDIIERLKAKNVEIGKVTLHVGAGTFKPVKSESIGDHLMHSEFVTIPEKTIDLLSKDRTVICVGTTSLRTIESIPYIARKIGHPSIEIDQWEPYSEQNSPEIDQNALNIIKNHLKTTGNDRILAQTGIMIVPGFNFVFSDILITNFHQPQSTLLLLVSAFIGEDWRKVYDYALQNSFRFLSYGDSSILYRN